MALYTLAADYLHEMKYRGPGESHRDACNRQAAALKDNDEHFRAYRDILLENRFSPGGRIQSAIGSAKHVTALNCYGSGIIEDSFIDGPGNIMQRATEAAATMRMGGGIGYDFSTLRPRGDLIKKLQSHSSGPVSFMNIFDAVCKTVASSGHRRGAQMGVLRCLAGSTMIHTLDGLKSIKELVDTRPYVYSCNVEDNSVEIVQADKVFISDTNRKIIRVHFDNIRWIDCTPDHLFMLADGQYREAQQLTTGTSLKAIKHAINKTMEAISNHKVAYIEELTTLETVYDITLPRLHNFAAEEVFVHNCDHPDIVQFINAKHDQFTLTGFNISVGITREFMEAIISNKPFELRYHGVTYNTVDANELFEMIMRSTWDWAEPGVLFLDTINDMNNLYYCEKISLTNPCVPGDTNILTSEGYSCIEDLVGKEINIWNGNEWSIVTPFSTGFNETVVVKFSDGTSLRCTPAHEFVIQEGWSKSGSVLKVEASNLRPGDKLCKFAMPFVETGIEILGDAYSQGFYSGDGNEGYTYSWVYEPKYNCINRLIGTISAESPSRKARTWRHGYMLPKNFVPINGTSTYCLEWLAGLLDTDGTVTKDKNGAGFQITSIDNTFLNNIRLMLTRLGVQAKVVKGHPERVTSIKGMEYNCKQTWRLLIGNWDAAYLVEKGLKLSRLIHDGTYPQRSAQQFVRVISVEDAEPCETFCFTEPKNHTGTFEGIVTGQCGEVPLPPFGCCLLGSFVLPKYLQRRPIPVSEVSNGTYSGYTFDWELFLSDIPHIVRSMDNVTDKTHYPLKDQETEQKSKRRIGIGITGLANCAEALGYPYGSKEFLEFENSVLSKMTHGCYHASVSLAKEKGSFPLYNAEKFLNGKFIKNLDEDIQWLIQKHGIRNSHLTSIAPTGTISMTSDNVSSGIEPVFSYGGPRPIQTINGPIEINLEDYGYKFLGVKGKLTRDVTVQDHVNVLLNAQKHIDQSISKTINCPNTTSWEDFKNVYIHAWEGGAKGCSTFTIDGKRAGLLKEGIETTMCEINPDTGEKECG